MISSCYDHCTRPVAPQSDCATGAVAWGSYCLLPRRKVTPRRAVSPTHTWTPLVTCGPDCRARDIFWVVYARCFGDVCGTFRFVIPRKLLTEQNRHGEKRGKLASSTRHEEAFKLKLRPTARRVSVSQKHTAFRAQILHLYSSGVQKVTLTLKTLFSLPRICVLVRP